MVCSSLGCVWPYFALLSLQYTSLYCKPIDRQGDVVRSVRVSLLYIHTRVAMHGRSFPSARVIVVVVPLPSVLNVFPSVESTTIVNVCVQFAGFEQN